MRAGISAAILLLSALPALCEELPTGRVGGRLKLADPREARPQGVDLRFQSAPGGRSKVPVTTIACPVEGDRWQCEVPAGELDLRLQASDFVPSYFWNVAVQPGKSLELPTVELVRGASLIGWAEMDGPVPHPETPVTVELSPVRSGRGSGTKAGQERLGRLTSKVEVNSRGFFQLRGIQAGEYTLTARLDGFSPATVSATALAGQENRLPEPIFLQRPVTLEVRLYPSLDPYGRAWQIEVLEGGHQPLTGSGALQRLGVFQADLAGFWSKDGLIPGSHYMLFVRDTAGSQWHLETLEVSSSMAPLEIRLEAVAVDGRITRKDEPLEATLWLTGSGDGNQRIRFDSDEEGRFFGTLPAEGEWGVDFERPDGGVQALDPVEIRRSPGKETARVEIRVPDTRLRIRVVDEQGRPGAGAEVILKNSEKRRREAQVTADGQGEVLLEGLAPGLVQLYASQGKTASDWQLYDVAEDREGPPARLVLRERLRLGGRVLSPEGPVPGSLVILFPGPLGDLNAWVRRGISEADGSFEVSLEKSFPRGSIALFAPGFAARLLPMPATWTPDQEITLAASQAGGALRVNVSSLGKEALTVSEVRHAGARLPLVDFVREGLARRDESGWYLLPSLEPGDYAICPGPASLPQQCASGQLSAGGELSLDLPKTKEEKSP